ncbi:hypothetical protein CANARDRAFT_177131 [[Candida] arabinofermentans NRRL YB-2248]|uniref:Uncharacterized protein n=1 Tax=[Candida] arabinofermentans NRRL YB-2248 TaxID=983967 RepID=A0A1E4SXQ1_9ASCO|nr:hypothetical protein CANARDRAFT_177131 [[Candida] arabinofermentans NRRL YB-2248]
MELIGYKNSKVSKSLLVHYYTICRRYDDAFRIILESKLSIDRFPADLLCYHLLIREKTDQVYEILKHLYEIDRKQILSQQIINKWLHLAIHQKKIQLVEKFFFGYIYCPRVPVTELSGERLLKICLLAREKLHFNLMAKVVRFQIERMKAQQKPAETVQKFRRKMSLLKFDGLLEKLGPVRVIDSGIFHRFGLSERENITVADFSTLINGLASQFPNLSYKEGLILIEQMHGFHVTEEKYRYSRDLHPDHQLFRMIRSAKLKGEHSLLASIDMDTFFDQYPLAKSKQGVPKRQSTKYKARRPVTTKPFNVLPLNIILKVIQETTNDLNISIHLISYMVKRRRCQLDHDTLLYLFKIMMSNLSIDLKPDQRVYEFLIDHHMKSDDLGSLISIIESYVEKGYTISNELYEGLRMKSLGIESQLSKVVPGFTYSYFTGPPSSPPEINNTEDGLSSAKACMEKINENPEEYLNYDGYLICCFSDHPLVHQLSNIVNVPVMGIFQACVLYALNSANDDNKVAILTSSKSWETILDNSLLKFFNGSNTPHDLPSFFLPTLASDVDVLKLADPENYAKLQGKIQQLIDQNARIILLGCAGLSTLDAKFMKDYPGTKFIDSIKIGIQLLAANVRFNEYLQ